MGKWQRAVECLMGTHDVRSFRADACQADNPIRKMHDLNVVAAGNYIVLDGRANAFLQHMIRNLAGLLMKIGTGEAHPEWALEVLIAKDRRVSAATAPPYGLYFVDAEYDAGFGLPKLPLGPHFLAPWMNA